MFFGLICQNVSELAIKVVMKLLLMQTNGNTQKSYLSVIQPQKVKLFTDENNKTYENLLDHFQLLRVISLFALCIHANHRTPGIANLIR